MASSTDYKNENPGIVTSDSLAAESIEDGGSFGANSDSRGPMGQPSAGTTANNRDTSGATVLPPAPDAEARQANEEWNEESQLNAARGLGKDAGVGPTYNVPSGGSDAADIEDRSKPKGKDLTEGGFDSDAPNASFNTDIGGKNDPGRAALQQFEEDNVPVAGGAGPRQDNIDGENPYDSLKNTSA